MRISTQNNEEPRKVCGELNESDEAGTQSEEVTNESNESKHIYKALTDIIRNYEGSMTCPKKNVLMLFVSILRKMDGAPVSKKRPS